MTIRHLNWEAANKQIFDVTIIGAGINGASIFKQLSQLGFKVLLLDKSDFGSGSSQTSAMMIWGGLLYLSNLDFRAVLNFSRDRDVLINDYANQITTKNFRYIPNNQWGRNKYLVYLALHFYWMLGNFRREKPRLEKCYKESKFIDPSYRNDSIIYQEGFLKQSDTRFILDWILDYQSEQTLALNYCAIDEGAYNNIDKLWSLTLTDLITSQQYHVKSKLIINCAGVWADKVNQQFGIQSPYKHVFSKGVFIGFERPESHDLPMIFELGEKGDVLTFIPWGPVSLWGPTETMESSIDDGFRVTCEDLSFLLQHANKHLCSSLDKSKIISLRCGLRPLAVDRSFSSDCYPLDISRYHKIFEEPNARWFTVYGGKISGCLSIANQVTKRVTKRITPMIGSKSLDAMLIDKVPEADSKILVPDLNIKVPSIDWCVKKEFCCTLEDYLRRRTNLAQWLPREGLGINDEHLPFVTELLSQLTYYSEKQRAEAMNNYVANVHRRFDDLLKQI